MLIKIENDYQTIKFLVKMYIFLFRYGLYLKITKSNWIIIWMLMHHCFMHSLEQFFLVPGIWLHNNSLQNIHWFAKLTKKIHFLKKEKKTFHGHFMVFIDATYISKTKIFFTYLDIVVQSLIYKCCWTNIGRFPGNMVYKYDLWNQTCLGILFIFLLPQLTILDNYVV